MTILTEPEIQENNTDKPYEKKHQQDTDKSKNEILPFFMLRPIDFFDLM